MKIPRSTSGDRWKQDVSLVMIAILAAAVLIGSTNCLPGLNADSITYLSMADQFLSGNGFSRLSGPTGTKPITIHPPFYAFMLASTEFLGFEPLKGALVLNAVLFSFNVIMVGILLRQISNHRYLPMIGAAIFSISPISIEWHSWAFSEPLYVSLSLLCFYLLAKFIQSRRLVNVLMLAILMGIAIITRYVAFALFFAIVLVLFLLSRNKKEKIVLLTIFSLISLLPIFSWVIRNIHLTGTASNHTINLHLIPRSKLKLFFNIFWEWFVGTKFTTNSLIISIAFFVSMIGLIGYVLLKNDIRSFFKRNIKEPTLLSAIVVYIFSFFVVLIMSVSILDFNLNIDQRISFPIYPIVIILLSVGIVHGVSQIAKIGRAKYIILFVAISVMVSYLIRDISLFAEIGFEDRGFGQIIAQHEYGHHDVASIPAETLIYTNNLELLYILYDRGGYHVPESWDPIQNTANPSYVETLLLVRDRVFEDSAILLFFNAEADEIDPRLVEDMVVYFDFGNEILYKAP